MMKAVFALALLLGCTANLSHNFDESRIVIVNIEQLDRGGIADEIDKLNALNPAVLAIDLRFDVSRHDQNDAKLVRTLWKCSNLVMPTLVDSLAGQRFVSFAGQPEFIPPGAGTGFVNVIQESDSNRTLRRFVVWEESNFGGDVVEFHFAVSVALKYDSAKTLNFVRRNPRIVDIDFGGGKRQFRNIPAKTVLENKLTREDIEGRIVLLSFMGPGEEDKYFTPLGKNSSKPDMYGVEYLAHIIAQILE